jgi:hypothetical protein
MTTTSFGRRVALGDDPHNDAESNMVEAMVKDLARKVIQRTPR